LELLEALTCCSAIAHLAFCSATIAQNGATDSCGANGSNGGQGGRLLSLELEAEASASSA
jgi:hypothetical protein